MNANVQRVPFLGAISFLEFGAWGLGFWVSSFGLSLIAPTSTSRRVSCKVEVWSWWAASFVSVGCFC